ncbi:MAG: hypothetical protein H0W73_04845 [Bacteroidetes bacterium]|nr:hypothetical protein [Bacteroidota bacterium]
MPAIKSYTNSIDTDNVKVFTQKPDSTNVDFFKKAVEKKRVSKDSLKNISNATKHFKDSLASTKKKFSGYKKFALGGSISNQFDYGAIPYYMADNAFPASLYRSNGSVNMRFGKIPIIADYFYSNPTYISGLNNYFTIRFDVNEFEKMRDKEYLDKTKDLKTKIDSMSLQNQKLKQQLALLESKKLNNFPGSIPKSDLNVAVPNFPSDSINLKNDSLKVQPYLNSVDSLKNIYAGLDTSTKKINELKNKIENTQKVIDLLKQKIAVIENPKPGVSPGKLFPQSKTLNFLEGVKKFEIGMCYPSYSTFMINQMAIKGLNFKYELKNAFINASAGKTVVNYSIQATNNAILNQIQNLTSVFDWTKNPNEKKIAAVKFGIGKENKNYIGIGGLFGTGTTGQNTSDIKNNFVIEVDGRYVYKFLNFEAAIAKSFLTDKNASPLNSELAGNSQNTNWDKSLQTKLFGVLPKIKTKFSFTYRIVEPFFKSFGVGFMRSDIQRYDTKLEQPFGSKFKVGFNYRRDEDNLKGLFSYKTVLQNYTYYAKVKLFKKRMDITLNYTDIFQRINNLAVNDSKLIKSNIKTGIISYSPRLKRFQSTNTFICNIYQLNDGVQTNQLENYSFSSFNQYRKWQLNSLNAFIHNTIKDSLNFSNAINNTIEGGYTFSESFRMLIGAKHAYELNDKISEFGYSATLNLKLHKLINIELKAEKLVIGDFINTLNYSGIKQFPYYGYIKLTSVF